MSGGTIGFQGFGRTRALEFPDGSSAPVSPPGRATLRYNPGSLAIEVSVDGSVYMALSTGGGGASPWVDDGGGNVRLQNAANDVVVGAAATAGGEKMRVVGDVRTEGQVQAVEVTSVPGSGLDLELSGDNGNITATVAGTTGFTVETSGRGRLLAAYPLVSEVHIGDPVGAVDFFQAQAVRTEIQTGSDASAFNVNDGTDDYINVDTATPSIDLGNAVTNPTFNFLGSGEVNLGDGALSLNELAGDPGATADRIKVYGKDAAGITELFTQDSAGNVTQITSGGSVVGGSAIPIADNTALAFRVFEATLGDNYIVVDTTDAAEELLFGNTSTDPDFTFVGTGTMDIARIDRAGFMQIGVNSCTSLQLSRNGVATTVNGRLAVLQTLQMTGEVILVEAAGDPGDVPNQGKVYTKDIAGITELFYLDDAANVVQITSGGAVNAGGGSPGGATTQVQYNNAGAFAGSANFTFDGTNVTMTQALFANGGLDRSAAAALALAPTNATSVTLGNGGNPVSVTTTLPDNTGTAWSIVDANGDAYMNITTTNAGEFVGFGNTNTSPDFFFIGASPAMGVGSDASGSVEAASFGPGSLFGFNRPMFVGTQSQATAITIGQSAAGLTVDSNSMSVSEAQVTVGMVNNTASAFNVNDPTTGADYLDINTTTAAEEITLGGAQNPAVTIDTTGDVLVGSTGASVGFLGAAAQARTAAYTVTNPVDRRSFDTTAIDITGLAEVVGTMIADLQGFGLFGT